MAGSVNISSVGGVPVASGDGLPLEGVDGIGAADDEAAESGGEGTLSAKLRLLTTQMTQLRETVAGIDTDLEARGGTVAMCYLPQARTATPTPMADQSNLYRKGMHLVIDVAAVTGSPSVVVTIQGKDSVFGQYYTLLASAAITGTGTTVLRLYPGLTNATNLTANDFLPDTWRVIATHGNEDSITYSIVASLK